MDIHLKTKPMEPDKLDLRSRLVQKGMRLWASAPLMPSQDAYNVTISHSHRFIWFRVAKVATRSILHALREQQISFEAEHAMSVHYPLNAYRDYFKFAFVRNPWDRLVSCWKNKIVDRHQPAPAGVVRWNDMSPALLKKLDSFAGFVEYVESMDVMNCDLHLRLQSNLIDLNSIDYLGHFESMDADMAQIFLQLGLQPNPLPLINQSSSRKNFRDYYDYDLEQRVAKIYQRDIQLFNYEF